MCGDSSEFQLCTGSVDKCIRVWDVRRAGDTACIATLDKFNGGGAGGGAGAGAGSGAGRGRGTRPVLCLFGGMPGGTGVEHACGCDCLCVCVGVRLRGLGDCLTV